MDDKEFLKQRVEDQIEWYDKKSGKNKQWHYACRFIVIFAAALIPLISGYMDSASDGVWFGSFKVIVGILGIIVGVLTGLSELAKFESKWVEYRSTAEALKHEKYLYQAKANGYGESDAFKLFVERVEFLISQENSRWKEFIQENKDD